MAWCLKPGKLVNGGCYTLSLSSGIFSRCYPQMTDDFCVPEAHRGHSGKREPSVQRERGRKRDDVLRKLQVALDGCVSASWGPGYIWGLTEEGS